MFYKLIRFFGIVRNCPSCESAWTGGCLEPELRKWCIACGPGPRGWIWNFLPISRWELKMNYEKFTEEEKRSLISDEDEDTHEVLPDNPPK